MSLASRATSARMATRYAAACNPVIEAAVDDNAADYARFVRQGGAKQRIGCGRTRAPPPDRLFFRNERLCERI